jgi:hypothetical protein
MLSQRQHETHVPLSDVIHGLPRLSTWTQDKQTAKDEN